MLNKEQFLAALRARITGLPKDDLERTLQYYSEMIDDRIEDGMTEFEAVADVGDPAELAEAILQKPVRQTAVRVPKAPKERRPMSGGKKAALIVCAILLIAAGIGVIIASLNTSGRNVMDKEYTFASANFETILIESGSADVELLPAKDGVCRVICTENASRKNIVGVTSGLLHIQRISKWSFFPISLAEDHIRVYLPDEAYDALQVKSSSGGVSVPADFRFRTAVIDASSGGIGFAADVTEKLSLKASSGGIALVNASPSTLSVSASSGGIALSNVNSDRVSLDVSSGGMKLTDVTCGDLDAESSSGAIRFQNVIASGTMTLECSSGSIKLDDCDAAELHIKCTSGSVSGHLLTPKTYTASATSGSVRVPQTSGGGICEVRTTSGSIHFD